MNKSHIDVIRAWKDPAYRASLSETERAALPENPAGTMDLTDAELGHVEGGTNYTAANLTNIIQLRLSAVDACPSAMCPFLSKVRFDLGKVTLFDRGSLIGGP
jgi:mersacidin/lichenicidin family type 2 lantibiotic